MKKIFNKKIGVLIFSLVCAGLANAVPVRSENEAVRLVQNSIAKHKFGGSQGTKCMRFYIDETDEEFEIDVRSNNAKCGGDPNVEPRLFRTGKLATDNFDYANSLGLEWDGSYNPID